MIEPPLTDWGSLQVKAFGQGSPRGAFGSRPTRAFTDTAAKVKILATLVLQQHRVPATCLDRDLFVLGQMERSGNSMKKSRLHGFTDEGSSVVVSKVQHASHVSLNIGSAFLNCLTNIALTQETERSESPQDTI